MLPTRSIVGFLLALCVLSCQGGPASARSLELEPCEIPGATSARSGTFRVPEDREAAGGRTLDLNIVVLPAREKDRARDPIVFLHGGPGGAATALAPLFEGSVWRNRRDVVLIDQRGTGKSGPLNCPSGGVEALLRELATFEVGDVDACLEGLDASLSMYTTTIAVEDLEEIRQALGYSEFNLIGGSYGTRVALEYLRRYPESIRTATLRGTAPPSLSIPSEFDADSMLALERVLLDCREDADCGRAFPDLRDRLDEVLRGLEEKPAIARVRDPGSGERVKVTVTRELFAGSLHYALYMAATQSRIPFWIHEASRGRYDDLLEATLRFAAALAPQLSMGMFLSVTCAEDAPFYDAEDVVAGARDTLLRGKFSATLHEACASWPVRPVPRAFKEPVRSSVPVLQISGDTDPVTPPRIAEEVDGHLEHGLHLVLPETGHSDLAPDCVEDLIDRFLESGKVEGLETGCISSIRRPRFRLD